MNIERRTSDIEDPVEDCHALALGVMLLAIARSRAASAVEVYRQELIAKGEKLTIAELLPPKQIGVVDGGPEFFAAASLLASEVSLGSIMLAPGVARVRWREPELMDFLSEEETNLWPAVRDAVAAGEVMRARMLAALKMPDFSALERARRAQFMRDMAVTAIALERFRLAHGRYPSELKEMQGEFLDFTPRDYFDDQPLRYRLRKRTPHREFSRRSANGREGV